MTELSQESNPKVISSYLIIARYNRTKWEGLRTEEFSVSEFSDDEEATDKGTAQKNAKRKAKELFPIKPFPLPQLSVKEGESLPSSDSAFSIGQLKGAQMLHTFYSDLHIQIDQLEEVQSGQTAYGKYKPEMKGKLDALVERFYAQLANFDVPPVQGTSVGDPGIGWIAVVDAVSFDPIIMEIAKKSNPLWRMYDIEVIPLNNDRTTQDIYELMTPVHWG